MQRLIASWFGTGLILRRLRGSDAGSGTLASLVTFALVLIIHGWILGLLLAICVTVLSLWSVRPFAEHDPGWVVVDEAAGVLWATIGLGGWAAVVALVVFRLADITKRFPGVGALDRRHDAVGVTFDDVVAGSYALAAGWLTVLLLSL
ncbi:MAG: phosphatidylglycerophosphatase A [Acidimicrobiia bacterium]